MGQGGLYNIILHTDIFKRCLKLLTRTFTNIIVEI